MKKILQITARVLLLASVVVSPLLLVSAGSPAPLYRPLSVVQHWYGFAYFLVDDDFLGYGENTRTGEANVLGVSDSIDMHAHKCCTLSGAFRLNVMFQESIPFDVHVSWFGSGWDSVYVMDAEDIWTECSTSPCDISGRTVIGVSFLANSPASDFRDYYLDAIQADFEDGSTATATATRTATRTRTPLPTFVSTCVPTSTGVASTVTRTPTNFGAATATPLATRPSATPFSTLDLPPFGIGFTEEFGSIAVSRWQAEGPGLSWVNTPGNAHNGSMRLDLSVDRADNNPTKLVWGRPSDARWVLTGFIMISDTVDYNGTFYLSLLGWNGSAWVSASGSETVVFVTPEDASGSWRIFRMTSISGYSAVAIGINGSVDYPSGSYAYFDDFTWSTRGSVSPGCGGSTATPQVLATVPGVPDCDDNMCIGITHVPGTPPCIGYDHFSFEIPAVSTYTVNGAKVCFDRYEIGEVRVGPYDLEFIKYLALFGLPILFGLWLVLKARA